LIVEEPAAPGGAKAAAEIEEAGGQGELGDAAVGAAAGTDECLHSPVVDLHEVRYLDGVAAIADNDRVTGNVQVAGVIRGLEHLQDDLGLTVSAQLR